MSALSRTISHRNQTSAAQNSGGRTKHRFVVNSGPSTFDRKRDRFTCLHFFLLFLYLHFLFLLLLFSFLPCLFLLLLRCLFLGLIFLLHVILLFPIPLLLFPFLLPSPSFLFLLFRPLLLLLLLSQFPFDLLLHIFIHFLLDTGHGPSGGGIESVGNDESDDEGNDEDDGEENLDAGGGNEQGIYEDIDSSEERLEVTLNVLSQTLSQGY